MDQLSPVAIVALFAGISKALTDVLFKPIRAFVERAAPDSTGAFIVDQITPLVAWFISGVFVGFSGINVFEGIMGDVPGIIFTAIVSGLGANLLHDFFTWPKTLARELYVYQDLEEEVVASAECCCDDG